MTQTLTDLPFSSIPVSKIQEIIALQDIIADSRNRTTEILQQYAPLSKDKGIQELITDCATLIVPTYKLQEMVDTIQTQLNEIQLIITDYLIPVEFPVDYSCLQKIFTYLPNSNQEQHRLDCISFSRTSKLFHKISKETLLEATILNEEISVPFQIYQYILMIPDYCFQDNSKLFKYCAKNNFSKEIIPTLNSLGFEIDKIFYNQENEKETTLIQQAIVNDDLHLFTQLMDFGANICAPDLPKNSLFYIVKHSRIEFLKYVISTGIDLNLHLDQYNNTCLTVASLCGNLKKVKVLVKAGMDLTPNNRYFFLAATESGNLELVKYLVSLKIRIDCTDGSANCMLIAAERGYLDIMKYLVTIGFGTDVKTPGGNGCLTLAVKYNHLDIISWLISLPSIRINLLSKNGNGKTALDIAKRKHHLEAIQMLENVPL